MIAGLPTAGVVWQLVCLACAVFGVWLTRRR